ncbi:hypothetical protein Lalb_Chr20g0123831 [Lupinus albus]|uniref:Uncharacterized protein n=1 Tax=Lupinus albus TaxID=3870 RepID=A0A6A4NVX8_LUPAL|nr:hypothetical protein Lalb_Chr20g0123831 [Lupinus albus]
MIISLLPKEPSIFQDFVEVSPFIEYKVSCRELNCCTSSSPSTSPSSSSPSAKSSILNCLFLHLCSLEKGSSHLKQSPFSLISLISTLDNLLNSPMFLALLFS